MTAKLVGLVLAGGQSWRMGRDKGLLEYGGKRQVLRAFELLREASEPVYVSVRKTQLTVPPYVQLPTVVDDGSAVGPAAGLLAAWANVPDAALLVLAVDMPLVDDTVLRDLAATRDTKAFATAFEHRDGTIEPLCAIWEPRAREELVERAKNGGGVSLRRILEDSGAKLVAPSDPSRLVSVNSPEDYEALCGRFAGSQ